MVLTQKTKYAIRALIELSKHRGKGPVKIAHIAAAQHIPRRFLEVILNQLKGSGLVQSKRGYHGGYTLVQSPKNITIRQVYLFLQQPFDTNLCIGCEADKKCPSGKECVFLPLWEKVITSVSNIYEETTIDDLITDHPEN